MPAELVLDDGEKVRRDDLRVPLDTDRIRRAVRRSNGRHIHDRAPGHEHGQWDRQEYPSHGHPPFRRAASRPHAATPALRQVLADDRTRLESPAADTPRRFSGNVQAPLERPAQQDVLRQSLCRDAALVTQALHRVANGPSRASAGRRQRVPARYASAHSWRYSRWTRRR